jgi:hypothetical protein
MLQMLQWMTGSLRSVNSILSHLTRRIHGGSSALSVAVLEKAMVEMAMAMERPAGRDQQSNPSPDPSGH